MAGFVNDYLRNSLEKRELHKITSPPIWLKQYLYYLNIIIFHNNAQKFKYINQTPRTKGWGMR